MKKLSYWSKRNPVTARIIIVISHVMLIIIGISFGIYSYLEEFHISMGFINLMVSAFFIAFLLYPIRGHKEGMYKYSYTRRVRHDFMLVMSSTCVLVAGVNNFAFQPLQSLPNQVPVQLMITTGIIEEVAPIKRGFVKSAFNQIKEYRTELKQQLKSMKAERRMNEGNKSGAKAVLILLTLVFAVGLFIGVASLSCNLSCSGHEGLATVVLLGGTIGILAGTIFAFTRILRMGKKPSPPNAPIESPVT